MSKRLGEVIACEDKTSSRHLNGFPDGSDIRSAQYNNDIVVVVVVFTLKTVLTYPVPFSFFFLFKAKKRISVVTS